MITLTDAAAKKIKEFVMKAGVSPETGGMRFGLKSGGCAGFQYFFNVCASPDEGDHVAEHNGARLFVDTESLALVKDSAIDYGWVAHLNGEGFIINNPNAGGSCGCGTSVRFDE